MKRENIKSYRLKTLCYIYIEVEVLHLIDKVTEILYNKDIFKFYSHALYLVIMPKIGL